MSFVRRKIDVSLILGKGDFGAAGENTVKLTGLRVSARLNKLGGPGFSNATLTVWGITQEVMNRCSNLGMPLNYLRTNSVLVEAGDVGGSIATAFFGTIQSAYQVFDGDGRSGLQIEAISGQIDQVKPVPPQSFQGQADVATVASGLAALMGLSFENSGVTTQLAPGAYFWGTARAQFDSLKRAAGFLSTEDNGTLAIWPPDGKRGGSVPDVNAETGMIGYPEYRDFGVRVSTIYNPNLLMGGQLNLTSKVLPKANGLWLIRQLTENLDAEQPGGEWFSHIDCMRLNAAADTL